jgi:glycosyltransferase involved in cell wall biosynthesis
MNNQSEMFKILFLITDLKYGGAQTLLRNLLGNLDRKKFQPQVACLFGGDLPVGDELREMGIVVTDLKMEKVWRFDAFWRLYQLLKKEEFSIVHGSLFHANIAARLVGKLAGIPVILTWRHSISIGPRWRDWVNRLTAKLDDKVVAVSNQVRRAEIDSTGISINKVEVIYNGIDVQEYYQVPQDECNMIRTEYNISDDAFVIGFIGRLHPVKNLDVLLDAFSLIQPRTKNALLVLAGRGEMLDQLRELTRSLGIGNNIVFLGHQTEITKILKTFDILVLPSRIEGFGLVLLEAMASGVPVIATNVGGIPEVVEDGITGLLVSPGDPNVLASAIYRLFNNQDLVDRLRMEGIRLVNHKFTIQKTTESIEDLYYHLLALKGIKL